MIFNFIKKKPVLPPPKTTVLIIMDGWGLSPVKEGNAPRLAKVPVMDELEKFYPKTTLQASGIAVGLPWGVMGNSEVGHTNLGAGKIIYQDLPRISRAIENGSFFKNEILLSAFKHTQKNNSALHLMGCLSSGGVHSHIDHLFALLEMIKQNFIPNEREPRNPKIFLHIFTDGRDAPAKSAPVYLKETNDKIKALGINVKIASVSGRYFAMDRDKHWERIQACYEAIIGKSKNQIEDVEKYLYKNYEKNETDEFIKPAVVIDAHKKPIGPLCDGDAIIFFNFRPDRAIQLASVFVDKSFTGFKAEKFSDLMFIGMTEYKEGLPMKIAFPEEPINFPCARVLSEIGKKQLHIAETEKYAHVTYFFNGGKEGAFADEDRILVPSPRIPTYDLKPEMSAKEITAQLIPKIKEGKYDFIIVNFANPDMVGHTGNLKATIKAVECTDRCVGQVINAAISIGGAVILTADHGNCEEMIDLQTGRPDKEHTTNPVPLVFISKENRKKIPDNKKFEQIIPNGTLADVTPTILDLMQIPANPEMTGYSLLKSLS